MYELNLLEAKNHGLKEDVKHVELHRRMQDAQTKEKELDMEVEATTIDNINKYDEETHNLRATGILRVHQSLS